MGLPVSEVEHNWFESAFGAWYSVVYAHRTVASARPEVEFAAGQLKLRSGHNVLDLCCGNGRHMAHLLKTSPHIVGLDYSPELLALARDTVGQAVPLIRADMRAIPFSPYFDAVVSFFTSFGYFFTDEENQGVVDGVARILKPAGGLFIDFLNGDHVRKTLVPESQREQQGYVIDEKRWISGDGRVNKTTTLSKDGVQVGASSESVRMYTLAQLTAILTQAGFAIDNVFGDHDGSSFGPGQPRMILVAHKV